LKFRIFNPNGFIFEPSEKLIFVMEQKIHQGISMLEQKDVIEDNLLKKISAVLKIPVEAFQNFDEEQAVNLISCNFSDNAMFNNRIEVFNNNPIEEIKKLHEEKIALYERMLKEKDEMMVRLEKLIKK
jgi:hypothetical protein